MYDPMILGPGSGTLSFFYAHPGLGKDFLRKLFTQQGVILSRDNRQLLEWLARGTYAIAVAPSELHATELISKGLPIELLHAEDFKEGGLINAGFGSVSLIDRPPHPYAAKVYINWLLSREGQIEWIKASGYPSRRLDVPREQFDPGVLPKEGVSYIPGYGEQYNRIAVEANEFAKTLIKQ
jgi:iron(III) transport system substrate-binding protein